MTVHGKTIMHLADWMTDGIELAFDNKIVAGRNRGDGHIAIDDVEAGVTFLHGYVQAIRYAINHMEPMEAPENDG